MPPEGGRSSAKAWDEHQFGRTLVKVASLRPPPPPPPAQQPLSWILCLLVVAATSCLASGSDTNNNNRLLLVATTDNPNSETFKRFNRSVAAYELDLIVLSSDKNAQGKYKRLDDTEKLEKLTKALAVYRNEPDLVLMITTDSRGTIVNDDKAAILSRFSRFKDSFRIVFSAESHCWPDPQLESRYPPAPANGLGDRFLNAANLIGDAASLWELFNSLQEAKQQEAASNDSSSWLQSQFTSLYLDDKRRLSLGIGLDHKAELFQNLNPQMESDVELEFESLGVRVKNTAYLTEPVVVHGNGTTGAATTWPATSQVTLNSLGNYLGKAWSSKGGCRLCNESTTQLDSSSPDIADGNADLPQVLLGLFVEEPTPFLDDFFTEVSKLNYPKQKIHLLMHNAVEYHNPQVQKFLTAYGSQYASQQTMDSSQLEWKARQFALDKCDQLAVDDQCHYYLSLDSLARLENPNTLRYLIEANQTIVAPLLSRPGKLWSNFWGAISSEGYYARSHDYVEMVKRNRVGLWNVPHIMNAYLIQGSYIRRCIQAARVMRATNDQEELPKLMYHETQDSSVAVKPALVFSRHLRTANAFQFMLNTHEFGHLVDPTTYNISVTNPDFYQLADNMEDWERNYLHENYSKIFEEDSDPSDNTISTNSSSLVSEEEESEAKHVGPNSKIEQPCQDVFWFPLVNDRFCQQLIEIMETFGQWSGGTNNDPRIEGGYESVPTRDIHMKQVGLHEMWLTFLREYVMPVQLKEFIGYEHDPPRAELAFVVRYHPAEQASLRPHHDASTYTLNIALNSPEIDYEGGGCRFVRYNCSVVESRKGWALLHPGRLTHYHEGLPVKSGTRYIMVTFVDP